MSDPKNESPEPEASAEAEPEVVAPSPAELDDLRKKAAAHDELAGLVKRVQADFLNYQDRVRREREESRKFMIEDFLRELLPALDTLDRCREELQKGPASPVSDAVGLAARELGRVLDRQGLKSVPAVGEKFNPALHEAIGTEPRADVPAMTVTREARSGWTLHGRLLRPAQVLVAQAAPTAEETSKEGSTVERGSV